MTGNGDGLTAAATAAADQLAAAVAETQPVMIRITHIYLTQSADRSTALARVYRHIMSSGHKAPAIFGLYADALLRLAEYEQRDALAGGPPEVR